MARPTASLAKVKLEEIVGGKGELHLDMQGVLSRGGRIPWRDRKKHLHERAGAPETSGGKERGQVCLVVTLSPPPSGQGRCAL